MSVVLSSPFFFISRGTLSSAFLFWPMYLYRNPPYFLHLLPALFSFVCMLWVTNPTIWCSIVESYNFSLLRRSYLKMTHGTQLSKAINDSQNLGAYKMSVQHLLTLEAAKFRYSPKGRFPSSKPQS